MGSRGPMGRSFSNGPRIITGFNRPGFNRPFRYPYYGHHHGFYSNYPWYGYGYGYPYYGYGYPWWWYDDYDNSNPNDYGSPDDSAGYYGDDTGYAEQQQAEIDRLEDEVNRLHQNREGRQASPTAQAQPASELHSVTELVFRDKHTEEVQNYAIVGQTFWIFDQQRTTKVPISALDVPATIEANNQRGVDFELPR